MKNMILLIALPFILGCTATAQTTPSKQPKTNRVETFSQLDSTEPAERPNWLQIVPESDKGFYFVGMSTKRTEKRHARNESFNDALIGFARYCGLNVQYLSEHRDTSIGGNGGLIDTFSNGNTIAKMQAEMLLGNVTTKDRYTEKYSNFYGGSFMGHAFVDSTLIYVPKEEMDLCRENRKQANTFLAQKTKKIKQLEVKNESLENQLIVEKQNTSVALAQAQQSSEFFKQVLNKPIVEKIEKPVIVSNKQFTFDKVTVQSFATWDRTEDLFIRLKNVNFGVRHYKDFAFKLQRGYGYNPISEERIRIGNFRGYCYYEQLYQCWEKFNYSDKDLAFTKASFTNMSENDKKILEVLAKNLPDIISKAVKKIAQSRAIGPPKTVTRNYKLTEHEQNLWIEQAKRMSINFS